jgi:hypothetical protein
VFTRAGTRWSQQAALTVVSDFRNIPFTDSGRSVSVSGDTAVIGALQGAYVFVRAGSTWTQQASLTPAGGAPLDEFGFSVSVDGDTAVIGAPGETADSTNLSNRPGAAYVFVRSGGAWNQAAELTAADGANGDAFGETVSVSGGTALVGITARSAAYVQDVVPSSATATATVQINPAAARLTVAPADLPAGTAGVAYAGPTFTASGGAGNGYTFRLSGLLPAGLTFDSASARLVGTRTQQGVFPGIVVAASDGHGGAGSRTYTLTVSALGVNGLPVAFPQPIYAPPTGKTEPDANNRAFIRGHYHSVLNRDEHGDGLTYWEDIINLVRTAPQQLGLPAGADPYQYVAKGFWESEEHRWREVESYYHNFLGRDLNLGNAYNLQERAYWTDQFRLYGAQEADVVRGFVTSAEYLFKHRADASLTAVLNADLLSGTATAAHLQDWAALLAALDSRRVPAPGAGATVTPAAYKAGLAANLGALDDETAKTGVLFDVLASDEYAQRALDSFYLAFVRRPGTPAEKQTLLGLRDGAGRPLPFGTIAELMLASGEYRTNATNSEV